MSKRTPKAPPTMLLEDEQEKWIVLPRWRTIFSESNHRLLISVLHQFFLLFLVSLCFGSIIGIIAANHLPGLDFSSAQLFLSTIMTISAAVFGIIIAFTTFWYGSALSSLEQVRSLIKGQLNLLNNEIEIIQPWHVGPKDGVKEPLRGKVIELARITDRFLEVLKMLRGRFNRAALGTYYDNSSFFKLDSVIRDIGGEWFKSIANLSEDRSLYDLGRSTKLKTSEISSTLSELNREVKAIITRIHGILEFTVPLLSMLAIFGISSTTFLLVSSLSEPISSNYHILISIATLGFWIIFQLSVVTYLFWKQIAVRYSAFQANRTVDREYTTTLENRVEIDYGSALMKDAKMALELHEELYSKNNTSEKPSEI
jgi:hypothetical protein